LFEIQLLAIDLEIQFRDADWYLLPMDYAEKEGNEVQKY